MTTLTLPVYDPARLAVALREQNLPGQRSKTAITKLRRERQRNRAGLGVRPPALAERLNARLARVYGAEIRRRGGETSIRTDKDSYRNLTVTDRKNSLTLLHVDGWRYYSSRERGHRAHLSYLCGTDDNGPWAVRIAGGITTVADGLSAVTPAAVRKAEWNGKKVRRQGDIYAIETTKAHDTPTGWIGDDRRYDRPAGQWVTSHHWNADTRYLTHHPEDGQKHKPLRVPYPARFAQQAAYGMGRAAGRGFGD